MSTFNPLFHSLNDNVSIIRTEDMKPGDEFVIQILPDADRFNDKYFYVENFYHSATGKHEVPCPKSTDPNHECLICNLSQELSEKGFRSLNRFFSKKSLFYVAAIVLDFKSTDDIYETFTADSLGSYDSLINQVVIFEMSPQLFKHLKSTKRRNRLKALDITLNYAFNIRCCNIDPKNKFSQSKFVPSEEYISKDLIRSHTNKSIVDLSSCVHIETTQNDLKDFIAHEFPAYDQIRSL